MSTSFNGTWYLVVRSFTSVLLVLPLHPMYEGTFGMKVANLRIEVFRFASPA